MLGDSKMREGKSWNKEKKLSASRTSLPTHQKQRPPKIAIVNFNLMINLFVNPESRDLPRVLNVQKGGEGDNSIFP